MHPPQHCWLRLFTWSVGVGGGGGGGNGGGGGSGEGGGGESTVGQHADTLQPVSE